MKLMMKSNQSGYFIFHKSSGPSVPLKDMLQFLKGHTKVKGLQFAHVEGESSLMPDLSLWENLHVVCGGQSWNELISGVETEVKPLVQLIKNPDILSQHATPWEKLAVSLIKASLMKTPHILIEICESEHSELNLFNFKKILSQMSQNKVIFLATGRPEDWLNEAHFLVRRNGYEFVIEELENSIKVKTKIA
jgi:hypothetical protein